jgi:predicted MFS family arabinose efflux permease
MTITTIAGGPLVATRPKLVSRALLIRFVSVIGASTSFYLMLSVVPMFARSGGASTSVAGLATTALSLSTTIGYLPTPRLVARYGHRRVLGVGLALLGAPALALAVSANLSVVLAVCVVRGIGFAITCVSGGALTAALIPAERRGEGLALVGIVSGVPSVVALPLGVWLGGHVGYGPVFVIAALAALAPLASLPALPGAVTRSNLRSADRAGVRTPGVLRLAVVFGSTTTAIGVFVTFLPLAAATAAAPALLGQPAAAIAGRWLAGRYGDRHGAARLLAPGVLVTAAGLALLGSHAPALVIAGAVLFGLGFGVTQNVTLTLMYSLVPESGYSMVSAVWNLAYDVGMGIGAAGFGVLAAHTGYPGGFLITAALLPVPLLLIAVRARRPAD